MIKGEILVEIHELRGQYAHKMSEHLKRVGKHALEGAMFVNNTEDAKAYYASQAKVSVLDELIEKIQKEGNA